MFNKSDQLYEKVDAFTGYGDEGRRICELISLEFASAITVLDVACGTAQDARLLASHYSVDGFDLQPDFVGLAANKVPDGTFKVADMRLFDIGKRCDVVQCLFRSIGYLLKENDVIQALQCFKRHLNPDCVILVEPWFGPEQWTQVYHGCNGRRAESKNLADERLRERGTSIDPTLRLSPR